MSRNKLYMTIMLACSVGYLYLWTGFAIPCFFKAITGIPCPACGTTRFLIGDFTHGNPLGIIVGAAMLLPIVVILDLLTRGDRVFRLYLWVEKKCRQPMVAAFLIGLVVLNWFWTINKGL
ncbi:MAG: DUF2752 domain-containing protein [Cytophagales bacterium]|nr:DUF2752 domain-containing protein [Cytophagales bacterium]